MTNEQAAAIVGNIQNHAGAKYLRTIHSAIGGQPIRVDVYGVLEAFGVTCPATQHAIKKLLAAGKRGKGEELADLREAGMSISRAIQMAEHREANAPPLDGPAK